MNKATIARRDMSAQRDDLIRKLWLILNDMSEDPDALSDEDFELWEIITAHSAVQSRLGGAPC